MWEKTKSFLTDSSMLLQHMSVRHVFASEDCVSSFVISGIEKEWAFVCFTLAFCLIWRALGNEHTSPPWAWESGTEGLVLPSFPLLVVALVTSPHLRFLSFFSPSSSSSSSSLFSTSSSSSFPCTLTYFFFFLEYFYGFCFKWN